MLKENKNRGAGLVTVVVVLAVSSILLSASVWLSFTHYNNVMTAETNDAERAELDLCAELICLSLEQDLNTLEDVCGDDSALALFYSLKDGDCSDVEEGEEVIGKSILLQGFEIYLLPKSFDDEAIVYELQYLRNEEVLATATYSFEKTDGKYYASHYTPEESSDTPTEVQS